MTKIIAYVVVKVEIEVDLSKTDQVIADHESAIKQSVVEQMDYKCEFEDKVESGDDGDNAIEVHAKIVGTEVMGVCDENPV